MKFSIPSKTLYGFASAVNRVINSKNALQILNNFLFVLEDDVLTITGADVENALIAKFEVMDAEGEGRYCLDARDLVELLKKLSDQPVTINIDEETFETTISNATGKYSMIALDGNQYPEYEDDKSGEEPMVFTIPADTFIKGIDNTIFAVGTDDFHPQMMGICMDIQEDRITFVATDTRKMVRYIDSNVKPGATVRSIIPVKPASILKSILNKDSSVTVTMTSKSASFKCDNFTLNCRFIKGRYPEYNRVIPNNNPYTMRVDRERFLNAVSRVGVFVDPGYGMEKFRITTDHIELKSSDTNLMRAGNEQLDCEYQGPDLVMGFSAPYLIEICNTLQTDEILIHLSDPGRPGVFCPTSNDDGTDLLMLLMPMNVQEF